jgi:prepilin-type N-terminal cleavage/methylation domain-containing protein
MRGKHRGLTLVEVSLTVALSALVSLVVYSTLSNGLKIWQDVHVKQPQEAVALFFEKLTDQVRNTFKYPGILFTGNQTSFSLPTIVRDRVQFGEAGVGLGLVKYIFDERPGQVQKAELTTSDIFENSAPSFSPALGGIDQVIFSYYFFDKKRKEHAWATEWPPLEGAPDSADFPLAVGVLLRLTENNKTYEYQRAIFIPYSGQ